MLSIFFFKVTAEVSNFLISVDAHNFNYFYPINKFTFLYDKFAKGTEMCFIQDPQRNTLNSISIFCLVNIGLL